jgi:hypothetical protein
MRIASNREFYSPIMRPNLQSRYAQKLWWLHLAQQNSTVSNAGYRNLVYPSSGLYGPGGWSAVLTRRSDRGELFSYQNVGADNTVFNTPLPGITATMPRTMVGVAVATVSGAATSGPLGGPASGGTWSPKISTTAGGAWSMQFYHTGGEVSVTGPQTVAWRPVQFACSWVPGVGITVAFDGVLQTSAFTQSAFGASASIGPFHNFQAGIAMCAVVARAFTRAELIDVTATPWAPYSAFFWVQRERREVVTAAAATTFKAAWARRQAHVISGGVV